MTYRPARIPVAALAGLALQEARLTPPQTKPEARKRLARALREIAPLEQEIAMLRAFLGREGLDVKADTQ